MGARTGHGGPGARSNPNLSKETGALATNVVPLTDHIVLKAVEAEEMTASGLVIPDSAKETPQHGNVVSVGPGKLNDQGQLETIELKAGDHILYQKYTGQEVTVDATEYIVIQFKDVLARLEESKTPAAASKRR
ncbi:MAG: co-chaperone GroES [Chloroflexi bacterium]|nr:MAG: co-chaperone GroES [Chloroflexota bacterium]